TKMCKYRSDFSPVFFLLVLTPVLAANIDPNCDYYQELELGQEYYIYNKEYPDGYPYGTACRWTGKSPPGTVIVLICNDVTLPNVGTRISVLSLIGNSRQSVKATGYRFRRLWTKISAMERITAVVLLSQPILLATTWQLVLLYRF